jgi:hypothetical protein
MRRRADVIRHGAESSQFTFNTRNWPIGSLVRYTGDRVAEHTGLVGKIIGYRPTNGLWVDFGNGKKRSSISVKYAVVVTRRS